MPWTCDSQSIFCQYVYHLLIIAQADAKYIKQRTDI